MFFWTHTWKWEKQFKNCTTACLQFWHLNWSAELTMNSASVICIYLFMHQSYWHWSSFQSLKSYKKKTNKHDHLGSQKIRALIAAIYSLEQAVVVALNVGKGPSQSKSSASSHITVNVYVCPGIKSGHLVLISDEELLLCEKNWDTLLMFISTLYLHKVPLVSSIKYISICTALTIWQQRKRTVLIKIEIPYPLGAR